MLKGVNLLRLGKKTYWQKPEACWLLKMLRCVLREIDDNPLRLPTLHTHTCYTRSITLRHTSSRLGLTCFHTFSGTSWFFWKCLYRSKVILHTPTRRMACNGMRNQIFHMHELLLKAPLRPATNICTVSPHLFLLFHLAQGLLSLSLSDALKENISGTNVEFHPPAELIHTRTVYFRPCSLYNVL